MTNVGGGGGGGGGGDDDLRQQLNDLLGQMRELQDLVEEIQNEELIIPPMPELEDVRLAEGPVPNPRKFTNKRMGDRICGESSRLIELGRSLRRLQSPLAAATEALAITQIRKFHGFMSSLNRFFETFLPPELVATIHLLPPEEAERALKKAFENAVNAKVESILSLLTQQVVHDLPGPGGPAVHRAALPGALAARIIRNYRPIGARVARAMGLRLPPAAARRAVQHANRHFLLHELAPDVIPHPLERPRSSRRQRKSRKTRKSRKNQRV